VDNAERIDDIVVEVASGERSFDQLAAWFRPRLLRATPPP